MSCNTDEKREKEYKEKKQCTKITFFFRKFEHLTKYDEEPPNFWFALLVSLTTLIVSIIHKAHNNISPSVDESSFPDCIDCMKIFSKYLESEIDYSNLDIYFKQNVNQQKQCCDDNIQELSQLINKILLAHEKISATRSIDKANKEHGPIVAHKAFIMSVEINDNCKGHHSYKMAMMNFDIAKNKIYELVKNISVKTDGFLIEYSGMYYVYSSIKFKNIEKHNKHAQTWHQFTYVERDKHCERLLTTLLNVCQDCTESRDTKFTGGVFYLLKGDLIRVFVDGQGLVDFGNEKTYLGVLMLSSN